MYKALVRSPLKTLHQMYKALVRSPLKTLHQMYKALVRSHLDYCDIIYHEPSQQHQPPLGVTLNSLIEKVEKIQYQEALAVTGTWQGSNRSKLYEELGWETLSGRRRGGGGGGVGAYLTSSQD